MRRSRGSVSFCVYTHDAKAKADAAAYLRPDLGPELDLHLANAKLERLASPLILGDYELLAHEFNRCREVNKLATCDFGKRCVHVRGILRLA